jgi:hypothetical protein
MQLSLGPRTAHMFFVIARTANVQETDEVSEPGDYQCFSAARHPLLNGNEALRFVRNFLSAIRANSMSMRYEPHLNTAMIHPTNPLLESILRSCFTPASLEPPQIVRTLAHPPTNPGLSNHHQPAFLDPTYHHTHALAEWSLVQLHSVLSTWPFLQAVEIPEPPFFIPYLPKIIKEHLLRSDGSSSIPNL